MALTARYYHSMPPPYDPDPQRYDGLDAVTVNGVEIGWRERARIRRQAQAARKRERLVGWLNTGDD